MNSTNRTANRLFLGIVGLLVTALGAAAILFAAVPAMRSPWEGALRSARRSVVETVGDQRLPGTSASWIGLAVVLLLVVVVVVLVVFIARQGRGRTGTAFRSGDDDEQVVIDVAAVRDLLEPHLTKHPELVSHHVSGYRVRRTPTLKITATCRRGVAPTDAAALVESALAHLDDALGTTLPALVQLDGGFRARTARVTRLQ